MDREQIKELLREVLGPNVPMVDHPQWVGIHCPLAPWKHAKGADLSPSAGVSVSDGGTSIYNCYGCHTKGPLVYLLKELEKYTGESYRELRKSIDGEEFLGGALPEWGSRMTEKSKIVFLDKAQYLDLYDPAAGHWYLQERGVSDEAAERMQLMVDPEDSAHEERILFPVFDRQQNLLGFSGRAVYKTAELKVRDYHGLPKAKCLLGEHLLRSEDEYVVVVEGLFDYARCVEYNVPAVAVMHSGITTFQYRKLLDIGKPLILMFDNDDAGTDATDKAIEMFRGKLPVMEALYPKRGGKSGKVKDPGVCTQEEMLWMVANARIV